MFDVRLFRGVKEPYKTAEQLGKAEKIAGFWKKGLLLLLAVFLITVIQAYFGMGNEYISGELNDRSSTEYEAVKTLFALGQILWALLSALFILLVPSLIFWALTDIGWKKFLIVQYFVLSIFLIEEVLLIPITILFGLGDLSNVFSLGIIGQTFTSHVFLLELLAGITLFKLGGMILQYSYIRRMAEKSRGFALFVVIGTNVIVLLFSTFLASMKLETLF